jgi:acylpyruvate hydrolase
LILANYKHQHEMGMGLVLGSRLFNVGFACVSLGMQSHVVEINEIGKFLLDAQEENGSWDDLSTLMNTLEALSQEKVDEISLPIDQVHLLPPVRNPSKIVCVGLNYADHCREQSIKIPESPTLFAKFPSSIIGPGDVINWPKGSSEQVDYEAELAIVIGKQSMNVPAAKAYEIIAGYTIVNDVSARDVQFADQQWVRGKSFDTFCPMGPVLVTHDQIEDPNSLGIRCRVNGETVQDSNTAEMIFKIPFLIEFISKTCTLLPGDVISTGTPAGVGVFRDPQVFLRSGDLVEVEIEGIGVLRNRVA